MAKHKPGVRPIAFTEGEAVSLESTARAFILTVLDPEKVPEFLKQKTGVSEFSKGMQSRVMLSDEEVRELKDSVKLEVK
jgi:hypothetical protein